MKEKFAFKPGDKIFAKVKGFVYWPARVNPIPEEVAIPPNKIPIFFFGTHEVYFISPNSCWPYDEKHKAKWGKPRARAHFNEGIDEIENNCTLFQYGVDVHAEDYLAQFYDFKRSNGDFSSGLKEEVKLKSNDILNKTPKSKRESIKKRNASGSSISTKENRSSSSTKIDLNKFEKEGGDNDNEKLESKNALVNEYQVVTASAYEDETFKIEKIVVNKSVGAVDTSNEIIMPKLSHSENSNDGEHMPKLRSKSLSSSKLTIKRKASALNIEKSDDGSDSEVVSSDNPNDEDFRPAKKTARVLKKSINKSPKVKKINLQQKNVRKPKAAPITIKGSKTAKKEKKVVSDADSLTSISSIDDWQEKDEKRRKEHEEMLKISHKEQILKEEMAIKEASRQARKKSRSRSSALEEEQKSSVQIVQTNLSREEMVEEKVKIEECKNGSSESPSVILIDISTTTVVPVIPKNSTESSNKTTGDLSIPDNKADVIMTQYDNKSDCQSLESKEETTKIDIVEDKIQAIHEKDSSVAAKSEPTKKMLKNVINKSNIKPSQKEKVTSKRQTNSRKRRIVESDESGEEVVDAGNKKLKLSRHDADLEAVVEVNVDMIALKSPTQPDSTALEESFVDETVAVKPILDKVKALQSYNSDIRSSLVLGHENYEKCLERFRSLCTMDIDLISLVTVWQLMDTVKKCRRYKRNEAIKNEAQNVYKRFLDIHSQSSADELQRAQVMLTQSRLNEGFKGDSAETMNGHSQNPTMPLFVDDMFHQGRQPLTHSDTRTKVVPVETTLVSTNSVSKSSISPVIPALSQPPLEASVTSSLTLDEEKMRLLSVDLEAKVSDILNKIEKNSVLNPINRQSMSHLLPSRTGEHVIQLPVEWESVDQHRGSGNRLSRDNAVDYDDDDDDDVEAVVKRIENVPIKQMDDDEEEEDDTSNHDDRVMAAVTMMDVDSGGGTSALDARIENLFNCSFVSAKDTGSSATLASSVTSAAVSSDTATSRPLPPTKVRQPTRVTVMTTIPGLEPDLPPPQRRDSPPMPPRDCHYSYRCQDNDALPLPSFTEDDYAASSTLGSTIAGSTVDNDIYDLLGV